MDTSPVIPQTVSTLKPGTWYLVVECEYCLTRHVLMADPSNGQGTIRDIHRATCPFCQRIGFHAPSTIQRYQHQDVTGKK